VVGAGPGEAESVVAGAVGVAVSGVDSPGVCAGSLGAVSSGVGSPLTAGKDWVGTGAGVSAAAEPELHTVGPRRTATTPSRKPARRAARPPEPVGDTWTDPDK